MKVDLLLCVIHMASKLPDNLSSFLLTECHIADLKLDPPFKHTKYGMITYQHRH